MHTTPSADFEFRAATFQWLSEQTELHNDVLPYSLLTQGFEFHGAQIRLLGPQGIFKPQCMDLPLSIATSPNSPYDDAFGKDGLLRYKYRGTDPYHRDNVGLRELMKSQTPLVYLHGVAVSQYVAVWPVFIVGDAVDSLTFTVAVDDGEPVTTNGVAMCKLHHAAFDRDFLAVTPDYLVEIRADLMLESDGPMLRHGLQGLNGSRIALPHSAKLRPDRDRLANRYQQFQARQG